MVIVNISKSCDGFRIQLRNPTQAWLEMKTPHCKWCKRMFVDVANGTATCLRRRIDGAECRICCSIKDETPFKYETREKSAAELKKLNGSTDVQAKWDGMVAKKVAGYSRTAIIDTSVHKYPTFIDTSAQVHRIFNYDVYCPPAIDTLPSLLLRCTVCVDLDFS